MSIIIINVTEQICYHAPRQKNIGIHRAAPDTFRPPGTGSINYVETHG
ncbi:hypothetical protein ACFL9S_11720 [Erwinia sp. AnSW2-5]